jgi:hypothetical protein
VAPLASMLAVPNPVAVTSPVADTVATPGPADCHVNPDVTATPAAFDAVSWPVWPMAVKRDVPVTVRGTGAVAVLGLKDVGDEQADAVRATREPASAARSPEPQALQTRHGRMT